MAFYNTFNELNTKTGTFLTFSNYMDDLTKWSVYGSNYKAVPSKFVTLYIDAEGYDNSSLPRVFNEFESNYNESNTKSLFWEILGKPNQTEDSLTCNINYVGDIEIQSYNEHEGIGYSEIYCYIPNEASEGQYGLDSNLIPTLISPVNSRSFNINSIVILYDIVSGTDVVESGKPMGIYFTGEVSNETITNQITKFVSNEDIYGAGTSYGLRICSRYIVSPSNVSLSEIQVQPENNSDLSRVLSLISESQTKMNELINKRFEIDQNYKNHLSIFKNSRTNVPYIRNVNGINYWFVNGKQVAESTIINDGNDCNCLDLNISISDNIISWVGSQSQYNKQIVWGVTRNGGQTQVDDLFLNDEEITAFSPLSITIARPTISVAPHTICYNMKAVVGVDEAYATTYIKFVWPSYIGLVTSNSDIPSSIVSESRNIDYKYSNTNSSYICYEYPESFGELTSIKDSRDIEYINDFTKTTITKTFTVDNVTYQVPYLRYIDKHPANVTNYTLKFS